MWHLPANAFTTTDLQAVETTATIFSRVIFFAAPTGLTDHTGEWRK
jgi:hypothetical protein